VSERLGLEHDAGQAVQPDELDEPLDLRLRALQAQRAPGMAQAPRERGEVEHQRGVRERQLGEVDHDVPRAGQRAREGLAAEALGRSVLIAATPQNTGLGLEVDDALQATPPEGRALYTCTLWVMVTVEDVEAALTNVIDPELGLDFVELGLIYGIEVDAGDVHVTFSLTSPGCPIGPQVSEQIEEFVGELDGVQSVESSMVFTPPWTPDRMSEDAKFALGF
jgi:metal-sulfur cluster biosynthetic enzyme